MSGSGGWIGVDLDGTLAHYDGWKGADHIGEPVPLMLERVKTWLRKGQEVRIMTARVWPYTKVLRPEVPMALPEGPEWVKAFKAACAIRQWCTDHVDRILPITCVKDMNMVELWDDRAVRVEKNTGRML